jgi:anti-sigma factor RsiW
MKAHAVETDLALFATGDLNPWRSALVRFHVARCAQCRETVDAFRRDRERLRQEASRMPPGLNWERLAAEMAANIRVGLEAGECVAPRRSKRAFWTPGWLSFPHLSFGWKIAGALTAATALVALALWLNFPAGDQAVLGKAMSQLLRGQLLHERGALNLEGRAGDDAGPVAEASPTGIELRENGGAVRISQGDLRPVNVSVSAQGSASARYVDADTGQVVITSVYVQ